MLVNLGCYSIQVKASTTNLYNIVVFVEFTDTDHSKHYDSVWGNCFLDNPNIDKLWNGDYKKSLKSYVKAISYNDINVESIFPQLNNEGKITPYELNNTSTYYAQYLDVLVNDAIQALINSNKLAANQLVDGNDDGCVDNVTIVVPCESNNSNDKFYGLRASFSGSKKLNNKNIANYNIITESGAYLSSGQSGLVIHEFMHTLGYADVYRFNTTGKVNPVGLWDIMSSESTYVQFPLAYQRYVIHNNFTIPEVSTSQSNYSLYSVSDAINNSAHKNNQAVIIKTDASDSEFFVVEYRKKAPQYVGGVLNDEAYERMIYGSGLIIYRINTTYTSNYLDTDPYYIYVFRPNETDKNNVYGDGAGDLNASYLSLESGMTSFGSSLPTATIADGAITYSDGTNSGIVISNVSSAAGDSITFDITLNNNVGENYWKSVSTSTIEGNQLDSTNIGNDLYFTLYNSSSSKLLKYSNSSWSELSNLPSGSDYRIASYNNDIYLSYIANKKVTLSKYSNNTFTTLYEDSAETNYYDMALIGDTTGIYLSYTNNYKGYGTAIKTIKYSSSGVSASIPTLNVSGNNPSISFNNGVLALAYRDAASNNKTHVYTLINNTWNEIANDYSCDSPNISIYNKHIIVNAKGNNTLSLYDYSLDRQTWQKLGSDLPGTGITEASFLYPNNDLYIVYSHGGSSDKAGVYYLYNNNWKMIGNALETTDNAGNIKGILVGDTIYSIYLKNKKIVIKKHVTESPTVLEKNKTVTYTVKHVSNKTTLFEKQYTDKIFNNISNPQIEIQKDSLTAKTYDGYKLVSISPMLAEGDFVDDNTTIVFNYEKQSDGEDTYLQISQDIASPGEIVYLNGNPVTIDANGKVNINTNSNVLITYTKANSNNSDIHTQYPTGMKVYLLKDDGSGKKIAEHYSNFDNILTYAGASIRITGKKGIRIITTIPTTKKNSLLNDGLNGYIVMEYGTVMCWANGLQNNEEPTLYKDANGTYKAKYGAKGRAYDRTANINSIYKEANGKTQYTNTLVGDYSDSQCNSDFAMRSYMIIRPKNAKDSSQDIVIYGGTLYRSIAYVALQNKNAFAVGTDGYEYIWKLIKTGYLDVYNSEYKTR